MVRRPARPGELKSFLRGPAANSHLAPPERWRPRRARTFPPSTFRPQPSQNDYAYPCTGNAECGRVISEAIANQTAWLLEAQGPDALMIAYLWQEGLGYLEAGTLIIPPAVNTIFTDSGAGNVRFDPALAAKYGAFHSTRGGPNVCAHHWLVICLGVGRHKRAPTALQLVFR